MAYCKLDLLIFLSESQELHYLNVQFLALRSLLSPWTVRPLREERRGVLGHWFPLVCVYVWVGCRSLKIWLYFNIIIFLFLLSVAPNITLFNVPRLIGSGMNATLLCAATGIPQPTVTWQRKDAMLSRVQHVANSTFVIVDVVQANSGMYSCVAFNAAGVSSKHANLTVQG